MTGTTILTCTTPMRPKIASKGSKLKRWIFVFALCLTGIANPGCSQDEASKDQLLSRADAAFAAGQYDKAEKEYRELLRLAPEDPTALRQLGSLYTDQGKIVQAYPLLKKAAELNPDDPDTQVKLGRILVSGGEYTLARDAALQVLEKQPGNEQALLLLVDASRTPEDMEDARQRVHGLRDKDQDRAGYHLALGALDLRQNEPARAEGEFKAALNLKPKSSEVYWALGALYLTRNDLKEAGQALKTAADLAPPQSPMQLRYADFLLKTGAAGEAKKILEEINSKRPDYLPPRVYLMKIACAERQDEDCAARVKNILAQDSVNYDALFQDGILNLAKGNAIAAIRDFEYLSNAYRQNPIVRYHLATAYLLYANTASEANRRDLTDSAERSLSEAINLDPHFDVARLLLAELQLRKGNPAVAVDLLVPLIQQRPQIAQAQYLLATAYLAQQKAEQALAVYRRMTELFPNDPQPFLLIGSLLLMQGQQADARKAFEKSNEISPEYLPAAERLVDMDIAAQQYAAAMDRIQKIIDKDPKLAQPWALRAKIYLAQRDFTHAEPDLLKAIDLDPKLEPAYTLLTQLYVASGRQEEAITKLTAFAEKNKTVPALMQLAMLQEQLKHFDAARDAYEKVLGIAPNFPLALNNLAMLYSEQPGQLDKAYDLAKKAKEAVNEPHIADTLGWILFKRGDYSDALPLLQESAGKLPNVAEVQYHLGMANYMLGDEGAARVALQKAADASADFKGRDEARDRLALLAIQVGAANPGVRTELEKYLQKWPNDPAALVRLAEVQERDGAVDEALKRYEKVAGDNPLYGPAIRQLARLYGRLSTDNAKAYDLVTKAREAYPDDPEIAKTLGILNYRRGYYPQSAELLKEAAAKGKDDAEVQFYLGEVYHQLKQYTECKAALGRALTLNLSPELADDARRALAECSETAPL
jgi:tetratricopeptide (TPR) repeat protein